MPVICSLDEHSLGCFNTLDSALAGTVRVYSELYKTTIVDTKAKSLCK